MQRLDCEQYSNEWWAARRGLPTASGFGKILTATGKPSAQAQRYLYELCADVRAPDENKIEPTEWMQRGTLLEAEARDWYSLHQGAEVEQVGFIINDENTLGASPDGLLPNETGLEIKCPKGSTHIGYLEKGKLPDTYAAQVHGSMIVTGFKRWVFVSYHPEFEPFVIEVTPNAFTEKLRAALDKFVRDLAALKQRRLK